VLGEGGVKEERGGFKEGHRGAGARAGLESIDPEGRKRKEHRLSVQLGGTEKASRIIAKAEKPPFQRLEKGGRKL